MVRFAADAFTLASALPEDPPGRQVMTQLIRCASSVGASYEEACGAESRRDFVHKLRIADKEVRESRYWLELVGARWQEHFGSSERLAAEAGELSAILSASIGTAVRRGSE
jgi:four helix bundle protein